MNAKTTGAVHTTVAEVADAALELTVVGSFSRLGFAARRRLFGWTDPPNGSLSGRVALVTGASSGLGLAAAQGLAGMGARVVLLGRDRARTDEARARIERATGNGDLAVVMADFARLADVRRAVDEVAGTCGRLDVVVHNAGTLTRRFSRTADGLEITAQTHVVAPFLLTAGLLDLLADSQGRVVTVTSGGMYTTGLDLTRLATPETEEFDGVKAYANAKRAQMVLTSEWAARFGSKGISFHAMHPGWADTAGVRASLPGFHRLLGPILRSPAQGVDTTLWLAWADEPRHSNGELWLDRHRRRAVHLPGTAVTQEEGNRLWDWCVSVSGANPGVTNQPHQENGPRRAVAGS